MINKKKYRLRRSKKYRMLVKNLKKYSMCVHKTSKHIYAQILSFDRKRVLVSASTLEKSFKFNNCYTGNKNSAKIVGKVIARRAISVNIKKNISFDRSGCKYHGRIKSLAESARESGLIF